MKCLLDWFGVTYWLSPSGTVRRKVGVRYEPDEDEEEGEEVEVDVEVDALEDDDESEDDDEGVLDSLFAVEELESPLFPSLFDSEPPPSFFPSAESLGFDAFGSFNLFE